MKRSFISVIAAICILAGMSAVCVFTVNADSNDTTGLGNFRVYHIRNAVTGKYLEVQGSVNADGTNVRMANYTGGSNQVWRVERLPYGGYKIKPSSISSTRVLNRSSSGSMNIWTDPGGILQEQHISLYRNNGMYTMKVCNEYIIGRASDNNAVTASSYSTAALWCFESIYTSFANSYSVKFPGLFGFDATGSDSDFESCFGTMGYSTYLHVNSYASSALSSLTYGYIFVFNGHGDENGAMLRFDCGDSSDHGIIIPANINSVDANEYATERLVYLSACKSGVSIGGGMPTYYTNLVNAMYEKGAHFVFGWTANITNGEADNWSKEFYQSLALGRTVNDAIYYANISQQSLVGKSYYLGDVNQVLYHP